MRFLAFPPMLAGLLLAAPAAQAQLKITPLTPAAIPASLRHEGKVVQALQYTDRTGTYRVLATQIGERPAPAQTEDGQRVDLYAYQYATGSGAPVLSWQVHDFVTDCPVDLLAQFEPRGLSVTDLDGNGVAEVWLIYRTVCRGDPSPSTQKIIMYEGKRKYAVRGTTRVTLAGADAADTYTMDAALKAAPAAFRQHATKLWQQHRDERM